MPEWTLQQKNAIEARGGTLLVSAAAGSGKTSVLVRRIVERISDSENPCRIDELLVVTFSRLAAAEMRERLSLAISSDPSNRFLYGQQMLLPKAHICTIDSFCSDIVRENFHKLNISPDYKIADENELSIFKSEALERVIENSYTESDKTFLYLVEQLGDKRGDEKLEEVILKLYEYSTAYPFPQDILDGFTEMYDSEKEVNDSGWIMQMKKSVCERLGYMSELTTAACEMSAKDEQLSEKYVPALKSDIINFKEITDNIDRMSWDDLSDKIEKLTLTRLGVVRGRKDDPLKNAVSGIRKIVGDQKKELLKVLVATEKEHLEDISYMAPEVKYLIKLVKDFSDEYFKIKTEKNSYSFSDIEHFALKLLCKKNDDGTVEQTETARELSSKITEILIDEYQDTNECQDMLFKCLSKDQTNMFMVGDVKQSIYRFRKAMPQIFLKKRASYEPYKDNNYPASITLGENFRSRKGVTDFVNFVFRQIMSPEIGDMYYDKDEELKASASYPESDTADSEVCYVEYDKNDSNFQHFSAEAECAARKIKAIVSSGKVFDRKSCEMRPATYRDICVIMRKLTGGCAKAYIEAFKRNGIPFSTDFSGNYFDNTEVSVVLSLLTAADNVLSDIELTAVMMSPIYAFTPDEMADIRLENQGVPIYTAVARMSERGNEKCRLFLEQLQTIRRLASVLPASALLMRIYELTGYMSMVKAMDNGKQRAANLMLLVEYASKFEESGYKGLTGFISFINRLRSVGKELASANVSSDSSDAVRIMTIHKSKGLEFPVCVLACLSAKFNNKALDGDILLHPELGIGLKRRDNETNNTFKTIPYMAVRYKIAGEELSEEMRCLYVAMTRAKEKLICMIETPDVSKLVEGMTNKLVGGERFSPIFVRNCKSFGEWITASLLGCTYGDELRKYMNRTVEIRRCESPIKVTVDNGLNVVGEVEADEKAVPDGDMLKSISDRLSYEYPYSYLNSVVAKKAASEFSHLDVSKKYFASKRPSFLQTGGLSSSQKGTAMHKFVQYADYNAAMNDMEAEINRMKESSLLTEKEAASLSRGQLKSFLSSGLVMRMAMSPNIIREKSFTISIPIGELYNDRRFENSDEKILIQGVADVVFEELDGIVIVDYKTDKVADGIELSEKYRDQLKIYCKAFEKIMERKVKQCLIYSFALNKTIEL